MAGKPMLIAVDTGNHSIKTPNTVFRACYTEYDGALGGDCLVYEGKSYSICDKKFPHEDNKANFDYMLLVMIAMAKEIMLKKEKRDLRLPEVIEQNVVLCLGLPPLHVKKYRDQYIEFYKRDYEFSYAGQKFKIHVDDVMIFSQCLAAANSQLGNIVSKGSNIYLIDIGGYTTDILNLVKESGSGRVELNKDCIRTMNKGVLRMYSSIVNRIEEEKDYEIPFMDLERYFLETKRSVQLEDQLHEIYDSVSKDYVFNLLNGFLEEGVKLTSAVPVFLGGGSQIFMSHIKDYFAGKSHRYEPIFITDVKANAQGYLDMGRNLRKE